VARVPFRTAGSMRGRRRWLAVPGVAIVVLLASCESHPTEGGPTSSSPSPIVSASPSIDPQAAAKATVLTVYQKMWDAQVKAYSSGTLKNAGLESVAADQALAKIKVTALYYQDHGTIMKGKPKLSPKVASISTGTDSDTVTITDCIDSTNYMQVYKKTGKPVGTVDSNRRHVATYTARTIATKWLITDFDIDRDRTC